MEVAESDNTFVIRPSFEQKFRPSVVQGIMSQVMSQKLNEKVYDTEKAVIWCQEICDEIKQNVKELNYDRYKIVVQASIAEQRGGGAKMAARCFWDSDTDNCAEHVFVNDNLFCVASVFGIYYY
eukprot:m.80916 g.80916  ORF g.80916 m.80916 type:complete len:124 (+) comp12785_c0_seq5:25-396(+)